MKEIELKSPLLKQYLRVQNGFKKEVKFKIKENRLRHECISIFTGTLKYSK